MTDSQWGAWEDFLGLIETRLEEVKKSIDEYDGGSDPSVLVDDLIDDVRGVRERIHAGLAHTVQTPVQTSAAEKRD
jgi:hypothetical protein